MGTRVGRSDVPRLKRWISALLWLPDDKQGFIPPAVRAGLRAYKAGGDVLYTTVPPFSTHLAGLVLHKLTGMKWVAEFRDPWTDSHFRTVGQRSRWTSAIERWLERQCLSAAAVVVSVTEGIRQGLIAKVPGKTWSDKFIVIRNGIAKLSLEPRRIGARKPFRILYLGSFYHRRDPFPFLQGLASLIHDGSYTTGDISVEFVGSCTDYRGSSVESRVRQLGLDSFVAIRPWIPYAEAQRLIAAADLLLFLAQDQPAQVPNKLYDYLAVRVPILAFTDPQGESARMLRQVGGHYLVSEDDPGGVAEAIRSAMLSTTSPGAGNYHVLQDWTTERQMAKLVAAVDHSWEGLADGQPQSVAARSIGVPSNDDRG